MKRIRNLLSKTDLNVITFSICVLIAGGLWFLNTLNKEYTTTISYPVNYTDLPKDRYLVNELPTKLTLEVRGKGFVLLRHKIGTSFLPFNISVTNSIPVSNRTSYEYTLKLNNIRDKISSQLNSSIRLVNVNPEEINFKFSPAALKTVPITPDVYYNLRKGYVIKDNIRVTPDSVTITGPKELIDSIQTVSTEKWNTGDINKNRSRMLGLIPIQGIVPDEKIKEVEVTLEIERVTEAKKRIILSARNVPDAMTIKLFPAYVDITFDVGLSRYDKIEDKDFSFIVDYAAIDSGSSYLEVQAVTTPPFIHNLKYTPQRVEFILEKK